MMFPSHLLATIALGLMLAKVRAFAPRDWMLAISFGVLIDIDHLTHLPGYIAQRGFAALTPGTMLRAGSEWQGFFHGPLALLVVVAAMLLFRSWIPIVFWGLHMVQDFVIARHYVHFGGAAEWGIIAALLALVVAILWHDHRATPRAPALAAHAAAVFGVAGMWRRKNK